MTHTPGHLVGHSGAGVTASVVPGSGPRRRALLGCALAAGSAGLRAQGSDPAAPLTIRFSHAVAEATPKGQTALKFKELAERKLPGRVHVQVYANSQLFGDDKEMQALMLGDVHIIAPSLAKFGPFTQQLQLFDLPFLFAHLDAVERFQSGPLGQKLLSSMHHKGIHGLGYLHNGMKQLSANQPLRLPGDAKGLTFRIQPSDVIDAQFLALGASTRKMAFSDVYAALEQHWVDGAENPWSNIYSQRFHHVQTHITETNHGVLDYMVVVNLKWWSSLDPYVQQGLSQAMREALDFGNQLARRSEADFRARVIADNRARVIALTAGELRAWREAMRPVWQRFEPVIGRGLIEAAAQPAAASSPV